MQPSPVTAQGLDGQAVRLRHATVTGLQLQGQGQGPITLIGAGSGRRSSIELAVGDLPGLARLGLLERPAMVVGMDLLDGDRR